MLLNVDFVAVIIAAALHFAFGSIWYAPPVLGRVWQRGMGYRSQEFKMSPFQLVGGFGVSFLTAWVFAALLEQFYIRDISHGAWLGFYIWLGFGLTKFFSGFLWTKEDFSVFLVNTGHSLIGLVFLGVFLTWW